MTQFQKGDRVRFSNVKSSGLKGLSGEGTVHIVDYPVIGVEADDGQYGLVWANGKNGEVVEKAHRFSVGQRVEVLPNDIFAAEGETTITELLDTVEGEDEIRYRVAKRGFIVYERFLRPVAEKKMPKSKIGDHVQVGDNESGCPTGKFKVTSYDGFGYYILESLEPGRHERDTPWYCYKLAMTLVPSLPTSYPAFEALVDEAKRIEGEDYHARKFDAGKADWTLLPELAAREIFEAHSAAYDDSDPLDADATKLFSDPCAAAEMLIEWRATGDREWLKKALLGLQGPALTKLALAVDVLGYGAQKYARDSWRLVPDAIDRYFSAAMRHLTAMAAGETVDAESGHQHLGHVTCNVVFLLELARDEGQA